MTKKIILFLVEGPTDRDALGLIVSKLVKDCEIEFLVMHTDITADENMTSKYIEKRINGIIDEYLHKKPFIMRRDILKVVQLIDTDGAFVPPEYVKQSRDGSTIYGEDKILAKDKDRLNRRNIGKRSVVYKLVRTSQVRYTISYEIYYFSRNMEHFLYGITEPLSIEDKEELAFEFAREYALHAELFLGVLHAPVISEEDNYTDSWKFIFEGKNSLGRYSNLGLFFCQNMVT